MTHSYLTVAFWLACMGLFEAYGLRWHIRYHETVAAYWAHRKCWQQARRAVESAERFADLRRQLVFFFLVAVIFLIAPH